MESEYDQKFEEMKKYIPFLDSMIQRLENSGLASNPRQAQLDKFRSLRGILLDKKKRLRMEILVKCEEVLIYLRAKIEQRDLNSMVETENSSSETDETYLQAARKKLKSVVSKLNVQDNRGTLPEIAKASKVEEVCVPGSKEPALFQRRPNKGTSVGSSTQSVSSVTETQQSKNNYTRVLHSPGVDDARSWSTSEKESDNVLFSRRSPRRHTPSYNKKERKKSKQIDKYGETKKLNITLNLSEKSLSSLNNKYNDADINTLMELKSQILDELKNTGDVSDTILKSYKKKNKNKKKYDMEDGELSDSESEVVESVDNSQDQNKRTMNLVNNKCNDEDPCENQICLVFNSKLIKSNMSTENIDIHNAIKVDTTNFESYNNDDTHNDCIENKNFINEQSINDAKNNDENVSTKLYSRGPSSVNEVSNSINTNETKIKSTFNTQSNEITRQKINYHHQLISDDMEGGKLSHSESEVIQSADRSEVIMGKDKSTMNLVNKTYSDEASHKIQIRIVINNKQIKSNISKENTDVHNPIKVDITDFESYHNEDKDNDSIENKNSNILNGQSISDAKTNDENVSTKLYSPGPSSVGEVSNSTNTNEIKNMITLNTQSNEITRQETNDNHQLISDDMENGKLSDSKSEVIRSVDSSGVVKDKDKSTMNLVNKTSNDDDPRQNQIGLVINNKQIRSNISTENIDVHNAIKVNITDFQSYRNEDKHNDSIENKNSNILNEQSLSDTKTNDESVSTKLFSPGQYSVDEVSNSTNTYETEIKTTLNMQSNEITKQEIYDNNQLMCRVENDEANVTCATKHKGDTGNYLPEWENTMESTESYQHEWDDTRKKNDKRIPVWEGNVKNKERYHPARIYPRKIIENRIPVWEDSRVMINFATRDMSYQGDNVDSYQQNYKDRFRYDNRESYNRPECPQTPIHPFDRLDCSSTPRPSLGKSDLPIARVHPFDRSDFKRSISQYGVNSDPRRSTNSDYNNRDDGKHRRFFNDTNFDTHSYPPSQINRSMNKSKFSQQDRRKSTIRESEERDRRKKSMERYDRKSRYRDSSVRKPYYEDYESDKLHYNNHSREKRDSGNYHEKNLKNNSDYYRREYRNYRKNHDAEEGKKDNFDTRRLRTASVGRALDHNNITNNIERRFELDKKNIIKSNDCKGDRSRRAASVGRELVNVTKSLRVNKEDLKSFKVIFDSKSCYKESQYKENCIASEVASSCDLLNMKKHDTESKKLWSTCNSLKGNKRDPRLRNDKCCDDNTRKYDCKSRCNDTKNYGIVYSIDNISKGKALPMGCGVKNYKIPKLKRTSTDTDISEATGTIKDSTSIDATISTKLVKDSSHDSNKNTINAEKIMHGTSKIAPCYVGKQNAKIKNIAVGVEETFSNIDSSEASTKIEKSTYKLCVDSNDNIEKRGTRSPKKLLNNEGKPSKEPFRKSRKRIVYISDSDSDESENVTEKGYKPEIPTDNVSIQIKSNKIFENSVSLSTAKTENMTNSNSDIGYKEALPEKVGDALSESNMHKTISGDTTIYIRENQEPTKTEVPKEIDSMHTLLSLLQDKSKLMELISKLSSDSIENEKIKKKLEKLSEIVSDDEDATQQDGAAAILDSKGPTTKENNNKKTGDKLIIQNSETTVKENNALLVEVTDNTEINMIGDSDKLPKPVNLLDNKGETTEITKKEEIGKEIDSLNQKELQNKENEKLLSNIKELELNKDTLDLSIENKTDAVHSDNISLEQVEDSLNSQSEKDSNCLKDEKPKKKKNIKKRRGKNKKKPAITQKKNTLKTMQPKIKKSSRELKNLLLNIDEFIKDDDLNSPGIRTRRLLKIRNEEVNERDDSIVQKCNDSDENTQNEYTKKKVFKEKYNLIDSSCNVVLESKINKQYLSVRPGPKSKTRPQDSDLDPYVFETDSVNEGNASESQTKSKSESKSELQLSSILNSEAEATTEKNIKIQVEEQARIIKPNNRRKQRVSSDTDGSLDNVKIPDFECFTDKSYCFQSKTSTYSCRLCNYIGPNIVAHYKKHHPFSEIPLSRFSPRAAKRAIKQCELIIMKQKCELVNFQAIRKIPTDKYTCRFCYKKFVKKELGEFFWHVVNMHTGEYVLTTPELQQCSDYFDTAKCPFSMDIPPPPASSKGQLLGYICGKCNFTQVSIENLKTHVIKRHNAEETEVYTISLSLLSNKAILNYLKDLDTQNSTLQGEELRTLGNTQSKQNLTECSNDGITTNEKSKSPPQSVENIQSQLTFECDNLNKISYCKLLTIDTAHETRKDTPHSDVLNKDVEINNPEKTQIGGDRLPSSDIFSYPHFKIQYTANSLREYVCCINGNDNHYKTTLFISMKRHIQLKHSENWDGYCFMCKVIVTPQGRHQFKDCLHHYFDKHIDDFPIANNVASDKDLEHDKAIEVAKGTECIDDPVQTVQTGYLQSPSQIVSTHNESQILDESNPGMPIIESVKSLRTTDQSLPSPSYPSFGTLEVAVEYKYEEAQADIMSKKHCVVLDTMMTHVNLIQIFKCAGKFCSFTTDSAEEALLHSSAHVRIGGEYALCCVYCNYDASGNAIDLVTHVFKNHGCCPYVCEVCFYRAAASQLVQAHINRVHPDKSARVLRTPVVIGTTEDENCLPRKQAVPFYICKGDHDTQNPCKFRAYTSSKFFEHMQQRHQNSKEILCFICSEALSSPVDLIRHLKTHGLKLYQCIWCVFGADSETELLKHSSAKHPSKQPKAFLRIITTKQGSNDVKVLPLVHLDKNHVTVLDIQPNVLTKNPVREAEKAIELEKHIGETISMVDASFSSTNSNAGTSKSLLVTQTNEIPETRPKRKRSLESKTKTIEPPEKLKKYGPQDIDKLPINPLMDDFVHCSLCDFRTKVKLNMVRHLQLHAQ